MSHPLFPRKRSPSPREAQRARRGFGPLERAQASAQHAASERLRGGRTVVRSVALGGSTAKTFTLNLVDEDAADTVIPYVAQTVYAEGTGTGTLGHRRTLFARCNEGLLDEVGGGPLYFPIWTARMADLLYTKGGSGGDGFLALAILGFTDAWDPLTLTWNNQPTPVSGAYYLNFASLRPRTAGSDTAGEVPAPGFAGFDSSDWTCALAAVASTLTPVLTDLTGFAISASLKDSFVLTGDTLEAGPFTNFERYQ